MPSSSLVRDARRDLAAFARLVDRPLTDWQAQGLRLDRRVTVVAAPRQTGKSRSLSVCATHRAFRKENQRVLIVSAGEDAAKRLLAEVRDLAAHPVLAGSVVDEAANLVRLSNGSEVRSVPASERQVRGWSVDLLLIDEAVLVDDDLIRSAAMPTTAARPDARIVLASSPRGRSGTFFTYFDRGVNGAEDIRSVRWRLSDASWITPEALRALREGLSPAQAAAELDAEFIDSADGDLLIEREWLEAARARSLPLPLDRRGVLSVDVARFGNDRTVGYLVSGGRVRRRFEGRGWSTTQSAGRVLAEVDTITAERLSVVVDDSGVGGGVTDQVRVTRSVLAFRGAERALRADRYANARAETHWAMRLAFEAGLLDLDPADEDLFEQLAGLRYEHDERGHVLIESKERMRRRGSRSPDHSDAVSMAFYRALPWGPISDADVDSDLARARLIDQLNARDRFRERQAERRADSAPYSSVPQDLTTRLRDRGFPTTRGALGGRW